MAAEDEMLGHKMEKRKTPPYWWPETQSIMQVFLAVAIVGMVGYILQQLLSGEALKIDPSVRDLIVFIFGIIFGNFKDVYGFTYGSSASDKSKGEAINRSIESKDKIIAAGVASTAEVAATASPPPNKESVAAAPWWPKLTDDEKSAIEARGKLDRSVEIFIAAAKIGAANGDDLIDIVKKNLLTPARATVIAAS